jgi:hypothetical protein
MEPHGRSIIINSATSQYDRWLSALDADYARVDERSFPALLDFANKFGGLVNFYDLKNAINGDWTDFFLNDPTMFLASFEAINPSQTESAFTRLERLTKQARPFEPKFNNLQATFDFVLQFARQLDRWYQTLSLSSESEAEQLFGQFIINEIENSLSEQLRLLEAYDLGAGLTETLGRAIGLDYAGFSPVWNLRNICADGSIYRGRTDNRKMNHALAPLKQIFFSFFDAIADLKRFAASHLDSTLKAANHKPHIALYIAFVKLFHTAQDTLNGFSTHYADFYYRDILRERERPALPDSVYLAFTLAASKTVHRSIVPRQTLFSAGQDSDGRDILYATNRDLLVTEASLTKLSTLRVLCEGLLPEGQASEVSSPLASPPSDSCVMKRILTSEVVTGADATTAATGGAVDAGEQKDWATFGETSVGSNALEVTKTATLGFAIASSTLLLTGGKRTVSLVIQYPFEFSEGTLAPLLRELSFATGLNTNTIFHKVLQSSFSLFVSTSTGWLGLETYTTNLSPAEGAGDPAIELVFELPPTLPAIEPYAPTAATLKATAATPQATGAAPQAKNGAAPTSLSSDPDDTASNPAPSLPTLKVYLRQEPVVLGGSGGTVSVYPLSLLGALPVTAFQIRAEVSNLNGLTIANIDGPVDASVPFLLFGGLPVVGSYLLIHHRELFAKTLDTLQVGINWFHLPPNDDGFKGYYRDYVIGLDGRPDNNLFDNRVFHAALGIRNPGTWSLSSPCYSPSVSPEGADVLLFRTEPGSPAGYDTLPKGRLCLQTTFDQLTIIPCDRPPFYKAEGSAIELRLTAPAYAFGNDLYAQNVLNAALAVLPQTDICEAKCLAECKVLADAALCIESCIECLTSFVEMSPPSSPPRIVTSPSGDEACINECVECLLALSQQVLQQSLTESKGLLIENTLREINASLATYHATYHQLPKAIRRSRVEQFWKKSLTLLQGKLPASLQNSLKRFPKFPKTILRIREAEETQGDATVPAGSLIDCLKNCKQELDSAYQTCLKDCIADCLSVKNVLKYPNAPYLPRATGLTVNYSSTCTIPATTTNGPDDLLFHLLPFGGYEPLWTATEAQPTLQPTLLPTFPNAGNLYFGFSGLSAPQTLTLLFHMSAGSDSDPAADPVQLDWEYLSNNSWTKLQASQLGADSTDGLQQTGIFILGLPALESADNTVLTSQYEWLRLSVNQPERFPNTISISTHVVQATRQDNNNTGAQLSKPLPSHTIKSPVKKLPDIATIEQPVESFGGRPPDDPRSFQIRVGERLRHKERAILGWDYEHLVLEQFPTIWKVRALPARNPERGEAPGNVLVVVVAGPNSIGVTDPTVPKATSDMLGQIHAYLKSHVGPFIQPHVVNPVYVRISVKTTVQFRDKDDSGTSIEQLNQELIQYLSPWYYDAARAARGGRYVSLDGVSEFIRTRPYVAAMLSIRFRYEPDPANLDWYFLTSAKKHSINDDSG